MTNAHPFPDPLQMFKWVLLFEGLLLVAFLAMCAGWFLSLTWALYHCSKYFPEGDQKTRWILVVVFVPVAGAVAYFAAGRPTCNRKFW